MPPVRTAPVVGSNTSTPRIVTTPLPGTREIQPPDAKFPKLGKGGVLMETFRRCDGDLVGFE